MSEICGYYVNPETNAVVFVTLAPDRTPEEEAAHLAHVAEWNASLDDWSWKCDLSDFDRAVVDFFFNESLSVSDIAARLETTMEEVRRAMGRYRREWRERYPKLPH